MMNGGPQLPVEVYSEPTSIYISNVAKLKECEAEAEIRFPMLLFRTYDEIVQIKRYMLTYYRPILAQWDVE